MPAISEYVPGDLVYVRSASPNWWPGVVTYVDAVKIIVGLDAPLPTGDEWVGQPIPYGGDSPVDKVTIWISSEVVSQGHGNGCHIKSRS